MLIAKHMKFAAEAGREVTLLQSPCRVFEFQAPTLIGLE